MYFFIFWCNSSLLIKLKLVLFIKFHHTILRTGVTLMRLSGQQVINQICLKIFCTIFLDIDWKNPNILKRIKIWIRTCIFMQSSSPMEMYRVKNWPWLKKKIITCFYYNHLILFQIPNWAANQKQNVWDPLSQRNNFRSYRPTSG